MTLAQQVNSLEQENAELRALTQLLLKQATDREERMLLKRARARSSR